MVDAQLDQLQQDQLHITFDPLDVPPDQFVIAGRGWQLIRSGEVAPELFGIFDWRGQWFAQDNLVRDFLALNKIELLPWDGWGLMAGPEDCVSIPLISPCSIGSRPSRSIRMRPLTTCARCIQVIRACTLDRNGGCEFMPRSGMNLWQNDVRPADWGLTLPLLEGV